jgi:hypothetical protein
MKTIILYLVTPLVTFTLGVGANRLISQRPIQTAPQPHVERLTQIPAPDTQVLAPAPQIVVPAHSEAPTPILILDYPEKENGLLAGFFIMGPKPREFADFNFLELSLAGDRNVDASSIYVHEEANTVWNSYNATFALVTERKLFFVTSKGTESDFEYRFEGEFVRTDFEKLADKKVAALRGKLTKTKDGRKIVEHTVSFRLEHIGC